MKKVLVTGASGLLASNTINELIASGYYVKALVRDKRKFILPVNNNIEVVEGDITDYSSMDSAVRECDFIVHSAAETRQGLSRYNDYYKSNVEGTRVLYTAAVNNKVKRVVHVSTSNVFGFGSLQDPGNEERKIKKPFSDSHYVKSKVASQDLALTFSDEIEVVIVNPTFLIGPYDQKPSSGRIILSGYNKRVVFYPAGGKNFVDVKDVSRSITSALKNGENKENYILSGENLSYKQFFRKVNKYSEKKAILIKIPSVVLFLIGIFGNILELIGVQNETTLRNMKILCVNNYYTNTKAKTKLQVTFNDIDGAIIEAIDWFKLMNISR